MDAPYVDYEFYVNTYMGASIPEQDFPRYAARASAYIDRLTFNRAAGTVEAELQKKVRMATCAVIEVLQGVSKGTILVGVASERTGNHSVSFTETGRSQSLFQKVGEAAELYLAGTSLVYRGVVSDRKNYDQLI